MYKKICALILAAAAVLLSFAGCHQKGETVVTIDGYDIPSGLYLAVQLNSFNEFSSNVQNQIGSTTSLSSISEYFKFTLDGVKAEDWIHNTTMTSLRKYVATEKKFTEAGLALDSGDTGMVDYYMSYYWDYNGYSSFYEANGVAKSSYRLIWENTAKSNKLFLYYYDKPDEETGLGGVYQVADSDIVTALGENYILANRLTVSTTDMTDDEKSNITSKLNAYAKRINNGSATFDAIKTEYDAENPSDTSSAASTATNTSTDSIYPASATVYNASSDATSFASVQSIKSESGFTYGKAIVTEDTDASSSYLTVIYDITKDDYYITNYRSSVLSTLKGDEFDGLMETAGNEYTVSENSSLVSRYAASNTKAASSK